MRQVQGLLLPKLAVFFVENARRDVQVSFWKKSPATIRSNLTPKVERRGKAVVTVRLAMAGIKGKTCLAEDV